MNETDLQDLINDVLSELMSVGDDEDDPLYELGERTSEIKRLWTYEESGMLTEDKGLVVTCHDGREFQVSIVRSR